jgi:hypothetical protein
MTNGFVDITRSLVVRIVARVGLWYSTEKVKGQFNVLFILAGFGKIRLSIRIAAWHLAYSYAHPVIVGSGLGKSQPELVCMVDMILVLLMQKWEIGQM